MKNYTTNTDVEITKEEAEKALAHYAQLEGRFVPKMHEYYYFITDCGSVVYDEWNDDTSVRWRLSQGNVFRTDEEARDHLKYLKAVAVIKEDKEEITYSRMATGDT